MNRPFEPKLLTLLRQGYSLSALRQDLLAGVIVGIVAVPLSIAFAVASGVRPQQGLATAVVAGFLISAFSGSRVQIGGPTGAFIVVVSGIVNTYGYDGLAAATFMAGGILILLGVARLGDLITFIPFPVTVGFTAGIAVIIFSNQVRYFWDPYGFAAGAATVLILVFWRRLTGRVPAPLVAILVTAAAGHALGWPLETIGSRFGSIPSAFPAPRLPHIDVHIALKLLGPAVTIALLAGIESLLSALVADGMIGRRHRSNMELIAQGIANIASPVFQGIPATGAIARTATNIKNGGRTPVAGLIHALTVLAIFLFFGKWAAYIPMASLAGILMVVAYNMSEWRVVLRLVRSGKGDALILLVTFALTIGVGLTAAIAVGTLMGLGKEIYRKGLNPRA